MPRIRTLKPEIVEDEALARCSRDARLLFGLLITQADDEGRFRGRASKVRASCFPFAGEPGFGDEHLSVHQVETWLCELAAEKLVGLYEVGGERYGVLTSWKRHQRIHNPGPSRLPAPPADQPFLFPIAPGALGASVPGALGEMPSGAPDEGFASPSRESRESLGRNSRLDLGSRSKDLGASSARSLASCSTPRAHEADAGAPAEPDLAPYIALFEELYPRGFDVGGQRALFECRRLLPPVAELRAALEAWVASEGWREQGGRFVPKPAKWIREAGWKLKPAKPNAPEPRRRKGPSLEQRRFDALRELHEMANWPGRTEQLDQLHERISTAMTVEAVDAILAEAKRAA